MGNFFLANLVGGGGHLRDVIHKLFVGFFHRRRLYTGEINMSTILRLFFINMIIEDYCWVFIILDRLYREVN
jgi:hypothetical protein